MVEADIARALSQMAQKVSPALRQWILAGEVGEWEAQLRAAGLFDEMQTFLARFGHRSAAPAELATPRWNDDPTPLLRLLAEPPPVPAAADDHAISVLLAAIDSRIRKDAQGCIDLLRILVPLQSTSLDTLARFLAGARRWAWGASHEAMSDDRITKEDDVFMFELEELKRMMTNEWNVSDSAEIKATAIRRRAEYDGWRGVAAPELLFGDTAAETLDRLEPSPVLLPELYLARSRPRSGDTLAKVAA